MHQNLRTFVALSAAAVCACGDSTGPDFGPPGLRIVAGDHQSDTIETKLAQAVVAELRDARGRPVRDHTLRFETVPIDPSRPDVLPHTAYVTGPDGSDYGHLTVQRTDDQGRVRALVRLGPRVGPALVIVTDPDKATADTATFTVNAGNAAYVVSGPADTSVYVGRTVSMRSIVTDRFFNPRTDAVSYSAIGSAVTLSGSTVTGGTLGTAQIVSAFGELADTVTISVPPEGTLAAYTPKGIAVFKTDGSGFTVLVPMSEDAPRGLTTAWAPSGTEVAFDRPVDNSLRIVTLDGAVRDLTTGTAWSIYPEYTRDGQWIYYSRQTPAPAVSPWRLRRIHPDGSGDELVPMQTPEEDVASSPAPDGARLVYVRGGIDELRMLDLASGVTTSLLVYGHQPAWSPTGALIAFLALEEGRAIQVMRPDGSDVRTVSGGLDGPYDWGLDWSPDGQWIVARHLGVNRLVTINPTTGQAIPLGATADFSAPSWKP
jgi:hypothetical protein